MKIILNIGSPNTIRRKKTDIFFLPFSFKKNKNPQISHFLKYGPDKGDGDVDGDGENFNIENFSENEMAYSQHVWKTTKKFWATFPMLNFSR